jgi:hypothetical protein
MLQQFGLIVLMFLLHKALLLVNILILFMSREMLIYQLVEDFITSSSTKPLSLIPVQFLV